MNERMNVRYGWMNERMIGSMNGWMDESINECIQSRDFEIKGTFRNVDLLWQLISKLTDFESYRNSDRSALEIATNEGMKARQWTKMMSKSRLDKTERTKCPNKETNEVNKCNE